MTYATVVPGADATHANADRIPAGLQAAGYSTGSPDIRWTAADWAARRGAVRIDQDWRAADPTADVLDVETGAATPAECADWHKRAAAGYQSAKRPGQRHPAFYVNLSNIHTVASDLAAAGITGAGLWIADWNLGQAAAEALITWGTSMGGPFPVVGIQYADTGGGGAYDLDVFSSAWLGQVSGPAAVPGTYGPPASLTARPGHHSVALAWKPPAPAAGLPGPVNYEVFIYRGTAASRLTLVPSYPRTGITATAVQEGSLEPGTVYTAHVTASGPGGAAVRPWTYAAVQFVTG